MRRLILLVSSLALALASCGTDTDTGAGATAATGPPIASATPGYRLDYEFPPWDEVAELFSYDTSEPLDYEVIGEDREAGATVYDITYQSSGYSVPAYLVIPDGPGTFPAVLYAHGMGGDRGHFLQDALPLAEDGYAGLLITGPYARPPFLIPSFLTTSYDAQQEMEGFPQYAIDLRRGLDLLQSLPEIDGERIAFVGFSLGAWMGAYLAGVEDRIGAYVLMSVNGWPCTGSADSGTSCHVIDLYGYPTPLPPRAELESYLADTIVTNAVPYVSHNEGATFLFQASKLDRYESVPTIRAVFEAAHEPKTLRWYPLGHSLGLDAYEFHRAWLQENL